eukprot:15061044-Ditylum_brightwellii.AAC.1
MAMTKNRTEYANTGKLADGATNCKNLITSHKASLSSSSSIRVDFSSLSLKPDYIPCPCWTCLHVLVSEKILHVLKEKLELWVL